MKKISKKISHLVRYTSSADSADPVLKTLEQRSLRMRPWFPMTSISSLLRAQKSCNFTAGEDLTTANASEEMWREIKIGSKQKIREINTER